jgi:hydroxymethylglutaryl-CoA reductase (NADPH)
MKKPDIQLVPRMEDQGYSREQIDRRRRWAEETTGSDLATVGRGALDAETLRGNIENPIGAAQVPLGLAGPLLIHGEHATGTFYVPLATTEGALVRSYERGMVTLTRAGGAHVRLHQDENRISPIFTFAEIEAAARFIAEVQACFEAVRAATEATTEHGKLLRLTCHPLGRQVVVEFSFATGDAQGMNMIVRAADAGCAWLVAHTSATSYEIFSGHSAEKRAAGSLLGGGKGKKVVAGALVPARLTRTYLNASPEQLAATWRRTVLGHLQTQAVGYNGHYANGLAALFIACGQDVANVVNAAVGITDLEVTADGDLYASVTLPSLTVATVGGGTALGTARECLALLGCVGTGKARKLAEITAATLLAGEISFAAAIAAGDMVDAHEIYGRNRPPAAE